VQTRNIVTTWVSVPCGPSSLRGLLQRLADVAPRAVGRTLFSVTGFGSLSSTVDFAAIVHSTKITRIRA
jgi:hypothetical protein